MLFDVARVRTRWLGRDDAVAGILTASVTMKCVMLSLEAIEKRSLLGLHTHFSVESTSGFISRSLFWWLNPLLVTGFKSILSVDDLPAVHEKLDSERLGDKLQAQWDKCEWIVALGIGVADTSHLGNQKRRHALAYACIWSLRWDIAAIVVPKFCSVGFSISQAYIVKSAVEFVNATGNESASPNHGYGLIGAFGLVYFGLAVSYAGGVYQAETDTYQVTTGWSSHLTFRLMSMIRGELTTVIYAKLLCLHKVDESAALTLMGTDVQRISETFHFALIEVVPSAVQLGIAVYLLYLQLGAVCVAPAIVSLGKMI